MHVDNNYMRGETMPVNKNLLSGSTTMLLLKLLAEKDMYGYEMIDTLQKRSNHVFDLKAGTLYPLLHTLEDQDYLQSYEDNEAAKPRKYYRITRKGKRYLNEKTEEWLEYMNAINGVLGGVH